MTRKRSPRTTGKHATMGKLDSALWRDIMAYLRRRHGPICRQWFEQLDLVAVDSGLLQVRTGSSVQRNYLQNKCLEPFTEAAQAVTGNLVAVRFVNDDEPRPTPAAPPGPASASNHTLARAAATAEPAHREPPRQTPSNHTPRPRHSDLFADQVVLSPDYSFDNFISGPNNQLAYAAAVAVANQPGTAYNPLFIHGGVGLGKTHLLQAICQKIMQAQPDVQILYVSCDAFMNQFIECVQSGQMHEFRHRYRHVD
ncbi:MAG: DnaA/Hda family protein, partial [Phycisphaeraceae bacterium]